jgi:putative Mg2+ transporter-C (MgtC) family protein
MLEQVTSSIEFNFVIDLLLALFCGLVIGSERELKKKPAGISTQTLVITGSMMFAFLSQTVGEGDPTRIAAQIVSGIGFLGAGIILKSESKKTVTNVTTAASIWYSAAVGMALGFNFHIIAVIASLYAVLISRIPRLNQSDD